MKPQLNVKKNILDKYGKYEERSLACCSLPPPHKLKAGVITAGAIASVIASLFGIGALPSTAHADIPITKVGNATPDSAVETFKDTPLSHSFITNLAYQNATIKLGSDSHIVVKRAGSTHGTHTFTYDYIVCVKDLPAKGSIDDFLTITWKDAGRDINGNKLSVRLDITKVYISSYNASWCKGQWGDENDHFETVFAFPSTTEGDSWSRPVLTNMGTANISATCEWTILDNDGNVVSLPSQYRFADIDQPVSAEYDSGIKDNYATKDNYTGAGKYAESIQIHSGVDRAYMPTDTWLNKDILSDSGGTHYYGTKSTGDTSDVRTSFLAHSPTGKVKFTWRASHVCQTALVNAYYGTLTSDDYPDPVKSTPNDIVTEGQTVKFNVEQTLPYVPSTSRPVSIQFKDVLDSHIDTSGISAKMFKGSKDVSDRWNISISGRTVTATCTNIAKSYGAHRLEITAKVGTSLNYSSMTKSGDYYIIPNTASVLLKPALDKATITKTTNTVNLRIKPAVLSISKRASLFEAQVGKAFSYSIVVKNTESSSTAHAVSVSDTVPAGLKVSSVSIQGPSGAVASANNLGNTVSASCSKLAYNETATITVNVVAESASNGKVIPNTASASCRNPKPGSANPVSSSDHVWVNSPALTLSKTVDNKKLSIGGKASYTVKLTQSGVAGTVAKNVVLRDVLPKAMTIDMNTVQVSGVPATATIPYDSNQAATTSNSVNITSNVSKDAASNTISLSINYLPAGSQITLTYSATATEAANGQYVYNQASATSSNTTAPPMVETDVYVNEPEMDIAKAADSFEYAPGAIVEYTVKARTPVAGTVADDVVVRDEVPSQLTLIPDSVSVSGASAIERVENRPSGITKTQGAPLPQPTVDTKGNIIQVSAAKCGSQEIVLTYKARVNDDAAGARPVNTATVTLSNPKRGTELDYPKRASDDIWVNDARMKVSKSADKYEYRVGETAHFVIGLRNEISAQGTMAKNVVLTDEQLPSDFKIDMSSIKVSGVPSPIHHPVDGHGTPTTETRDNNWVLTPNENGNGFTLSIPYFPDTAVVAVTYDAVAVKEINGLDALNHAKVEDDNPNDPGDETETHIWVNDAQLKVVKSTPDFEHKVGETAEYTVSVSNIAAGTIAKNVVIEDVSLPEGAVLIPNSISVEGISEQIDYNVADKGALSASTEKRDNLITAVYADGSACPVSIGAPATGFDVTSSVVGSNGFKINIPYLVSAEVATIKYTVRFDEPTNGDIVKNTAHASCDNLVPGQLEEDLLDSEVVYINTPRKTISKSADKYEVHVGENIHYTIVVDNTAENTIAGAPVTVRDVLPQGLSLVEGSVKVSGIPSSIDYPIKGDKSGNSFETRDNTWSMEMNKDNNTLVVLVPYLRAGEPMTIEYDAIADESTNGKQLVNVARPEDPKDPETPEDTTTVLVNSPKLEISKQANGHEYRVGDVIDYTISVRSLIPGTIARNVSIEDVIPDNFELIDGSVRIAGGDAQANGFTASTANGKLLVSIAEMTAGEILVSYQVRAKDESAGERYINHARLTFENIPPLDADEYPKEGIDDIWVNSARTNTTKSADKFEYEMGETAHFIIGLSNVSAAGTIAKNVVLTDTQLPEDFKIDLSSIRVSGVPEAISYPIDGNGILREEERTNTWELVPHESGASFDFHIAYLPQGALVTIEYDAVAVKEINGLDALDRVTAKSDDPSDPGSSSEVHVWTNTADLSIEKTTDKAEYQIGDEVLYTLLLDNAAAGTVGKNVYVADVSLPAYLKLVSGSVAVEGVPETVLYPESDENGNRVEYEYANACSVLYEGDEGFDTALAEASYINHEYTYNPLAAGGNGFIVKIDYLPAGTPVNITYKALVAEEANGHDTENFASADCDNSMPRVPETEEGDEPGEPADPEKGPVHDEALVSINSPKVEIDKFADKQVAKPGDTVHYTLMSKNLASGTVADDIVFEDSFVPALPVEHKNVTVYGITGEDRVNIDNAVITDENGTLCVKTDAQLIAKGTLIETFNREDIESEKINSEGATLFDTIVVEYDIAVTAEMISSNYKNIAKVTPSNGEPDTDYEELYVPSIKKGYQTTVYKSADPASGSLIEAGQKISYTLTVKNTGKDTAPYTHIRDYIPDGVSFEGIENGGVYVPAIESAEDVPVNANVSADSGRGYVEWVVEDLSPNEEAMVRYSVIVDTPAEGEKLPLYIRNIALYETTPDNPGVPGKIPAAKIPTIESNEVSHATDPEHPVPAIIDVEKTSEPESGAIVRNTDKITYTLIVRNNGGSNGKNVLVRDCIDEHLSVDVPSIMGNGAYDTATHRIDWLIDEIGAGEQIELSFTATVVNSMPTDIISNQALFENEWDDARADDPINSTNIIEHISDGDYMVADDLIEIIPETGATIEVMAVIAVSLIGIGMFIIRRRYVSKK